MHVVCLRVEFLTSLHFLLRVNKFPEGMCVSRLVCVHRFTRQWPWFAGVSSAVERLCLQGEAPWALLLTSADAMGVPIEGQFSESRVGLGSGGG